MSVGKKVIIAMLKTIGLAGAVGVVIVAPNALMALEKFSKKLNNNKIVRKQFAYYLRDTSLFDIEPLGNARFAIRLSSSGAQRLQKLRLESYKIPKTESWDGRWHVLMFDISEKHKNVRNHFAMHIKLLGMAPIQDSVYVYPYDVSELAYLIRAQFPSVAAFIISGSLTRIDGDVQLKKYFHLSPASTGKSNNPR